MRYKCVPDGMRLLDYVRGYKQISAIKRIPIAREGGEVVIGLEDIVARDLLIPGKPYMKTATMEALFDDEVVIEEKVDGHPMIALYQGYTFFCESLKVRHSVDYDACPYSSDGWPDMLVVYDVLDGEVDPPYAAGQGTGKWLTRSEKEAVCDMVGAPVVPLVFRGRVSPEDVPALADRMSSFGSSPSEGVVIKNHRKGIFGKFVNIEFQKRLTDEDTWGGVHPEQLGIKNVRRIAASVAARRVLGGGGPTLGPSGVSPERGSHMDRMEFFRRWGSSPIVRFDRTGSVSIPSYAEVGAVARDDLARVDRIARSSPRFTLRAVPNPSNIRMFEYDPEDILATRSGKDPVEKFSWNPVTGEILFVHPPQQHATAKGDADFDDYVRAIVLHRQRKVLFRPFWPTWMRRTPYDRFDEEAAAVSFDAQWHAKEMVESHGGAGWDIEMNTNNRALAEMTGRRTW